MNQAGTTSGTRTSTEAPTAPNSSNAARTHRSNPAALNPTTRTGPNNTTNNPGATPGPTSSLIVYFSMLLPLLPLAVMGGGCSDQVPCDCHHYLSESRSTGFISNCYITVFLFLFCQGLNKVSWTSNQQYFHHRVFRGPPHPFNFQKKYLKFFI